MKTVTATFHWAINYGAFLQAWALQQFLGKSNIILNFVPRPTLHNYSGARIRRLLPFFWRFIALWRRLSRKIYFDEMNMLELSRKYGTLEEIIEEPPCTDAYITGSDQVWNTYTLEKWKVYFLTFGSSEIKRIAYAASMGAKEWPSAFTQQVLPHLKKFHAISVRESSCIPFLNSIGLENIAVTCDPTLLFTADFYRSYFSQYKTQYHEYVFVHSVGKENFTADVQKFFNKKNVVIGKVPIRDRTHASVAQWLHNIDAADAVVTDSFHCTVFSILFHKPFISLSYLNSKKSDERFISLLQKVNLQYRLLDGNKTTPEEIEDIFCRPIDWEQVDSILEKWRTESGNWLRGTLNDN